MCLNFSSTAGTWVTEALCKSRASLCEQTRLLEPSTRRWRPTPRRWTCPMLLRQHPSGCVTWCIHSTLKINDMSYNQLISDPSMYVKKRAQRSEDSILLRHMDDVVGTGPDSHLMSVFEHMKTSLYLTDVVVLRHKATQSTFLGLETTKTSKGFEVKNSTDFVESLLNLYGLENSKPTANLGRRSVMELASATLWMVMTVAAFAQPSENPSSWHLGVLTCNLPSNNYPHKSSTPRQRASAQ